MRINPAKRTCKLEKNKRITSITFFPALLLKITVMPVQIAHIVNIKPASTRIICISSWLAKKSEVNIKTNIITVVVIPDTNVP